RDQAKATLPRGAQQGRLDIEAAAVVADLRLDAVRVHRYRDVNLARTTVLADVGQRLVNDVQERHLLGRGEKCHLAMQRETWLDVGPRRERLRDIPQGPRERSVQENGRVDRARQTTQLGIERRELCIEVFHPSCYELLLRVVLQHGP